MKHRKDLWTTNTASLVDAYVAIANGYIALPFGIYDEETLIGFIMFGYGSLEDDDELKIANDNYCVVKVLYENAGFIENGEMCGNEVVAVLKL